MIQKKEILQKALNLALAIYRLTTKLPAGEFLSTQLRRLSVELIGELHDENYIDCQKKFELLFIYIKICRAQKWVKDINWLIIEHEYHILKEQVYGLVGAGEIAVSKKIEKKATLEREIADIMSHNNIEHKKTTHNNSFDTELSDRQQKIINEIRTKSSIKMSNLIPLFENEVSERTLRNDLQELVEMRYIKKTGSHKSTVYFII